MIFKKKQIDSWEKAYRLKFVNSLSGYKSVHLIGTKNDNGSANLAVFNSIVHISSNPARIAFVMRSLSVPRHTYNNIMETGFYTINHVHKSFFKQAHYTSAKVESDQSEFDVCNLNEEYVEQFSAPFVAESTMKMGMKLVEDIEIKEGQCRLIVGEVQFVEAKEEYLDEDGQLDLEKANDVCITGLNQYSSVKKLENIPYARVGKLPNFYQKERPDNIVFDKESQSYNANLLPYGTSVGAPHIKADNLSRWKIQGVTSFNHVLKSKVDSIKETYQSLLESYRVNELLYKSKFEFEPIVGEIYHLYQKDNRNENFLSLIPPNSWKRKHLGSFKLDTDKVWNELKK